MRTIRLDAWICLVLLLVILISPPALASVAVLIEGPSAVTTPSSSYPAHFIEVAGEQYFLARTSDLAEPMRLYRIDSGTGNAVLVPAFPNEGHLIDDLSYFYDEQYALRFDGYGSRVLFRGYGASGGAEIWSVASDGSDLQEIIDYGPGYTAGAYFPIGEVASGLVYGTGTGYCKTDGTAANTVCFSPAAFEWTATFVGDYFYYTSGSSVYRSDGTAVGTTLLFTFPLSPSTLGSFQNQFLFTQGQELWSVTGTTLAPVGVGLPTPFTSLAELPTQLLLTAATEMWSYDGSAVSPVLDLSTDPTASAWGTHLGNVGSDALIEVDCASGDLAVWKSDGTSLGTTDLTGCIFTSITPLGEIGGKVVFAGGDASTGQELWVSDGTGTGTTMLKEFASGPKSGVTAPFMDYDDPYGSSRLDMGVQGGFGYFSAWHDTHGYELWKTDGTLAGTTFVANLRSDLPVGSHTPLPAIPGAMMFPSYGSGLGRELWETDGTAGNVSLVVDLNPGPSNGYGGGGHAPQQAVFQGELFYAGNDGSGWSLYKTDGTAIGTVEVSSTCGVSDVLRPGTNLMLFRSDTDRPCITDGTDAGTLVLGGALELVEPQLRYAEDTVFTDGDIAFFTAEKGSNTQLYLTEGIPGQNSDITTHAANLGSSGSLKVGKQGAIYSGTGGYWYYDESGNGTFLAGGTPVTEPATAGDHVLFEQKVNGVFLSDGTVPGTSLLIPPYPGLPAVGDRYTIMAFQETADRRLFYVTRVAGEGEALYISDGTLLGTMKLPDTYPGPADSHYENFKLWGDGLIFQACAPATGCEIWGSNGTPGGTRLLGEVVVGAESGWPTNMVAHAEGILFEGTRPDAPGALFFLPLACGNGVLDSGEACDDGNVLDDDSCSSTCDHQSNPTIVGSGLGGALDLSFSSFGGLTVTSADTTGLDAVDAAKLLARAVNEEPTLVGAGVFALVQEGELYVNSPLSAGSSTDPGLTIDVPEPGRWLTLAAGVALLSFLVRRRAAP